MLPIILARTRSVVADGGRIALRSAGEDGSRDKSCSGAGRGDMLTVSLGTVAAGLAPQMGV